MVLSKRRGQVQEGQGTMKGTQARERGGDVYLRGRREKCKNGEWRRKERAERGEELGDGGTSGNKFRGGEGDKSARTRLLYSV